MSDVKHTPGPWCVPDQTWSVNLTVEVDGQALVQCPGSGGAMSYTNTICTLNWNRTPEWEANARLIAAAPDLLEALNGLIEEIDDCAQPSDWDFYDASRAAIARAKGGDT